MQAYVCDTWGSFLSDFGSKTPLRAAQSFLRPVLQLETLSSQSFLLSSPGVRPTSQSEGSASFSVSLLFVLQQRFIQ